jgi:hypothetical protein
MMSAALLTRCSVGTEMMMGRGLDNEDPTRMPRSRNWSGLNCKSSNNLDFSINVNEDGNSIEVITLSTGHSRASLVE